VEQREYSINSQLAECNSEPEVGVGGIQSEITGFTEINYVFHDFLNLCGLSPLSSKHAFQIAG